MRLRKTISLLLVVTLLFSSVATARADGTDNTENGEIMGFKDENGDGILSEGELTIADVYVMMTYQMSAVWNVATMDLGDQIKNATAYKNYLQGIENGTHSNQEVGRFLYDESGTPRFVFAHTMANLAQAIYEELFSGSKVGYKVLRGVSRNELVQRVYDGINSYTGSLSESDITSSLNTINTYDYSGRLINLEKNSYGFRIWNTSDLSDKCLYRTGTIDRMGCAYITDSGSWSYLSNVKKAYTSYNPTFYDTGYIESFVDLYFDNASYESCWFENSNIAFASFKDVVLYYSGQANHYIGSGSFDVSGTSSLPLGILANTDWNNVSSQLHNSIGSNISSSNLTNSEAIGIVDGYFEDLKDALGSINEGVEDNGETLDDILESLNKSGERQSSWLAKIYYLLEDNLPLSISGGSSTGGGIDYSEPLDNIITLLEKNVDTLEDIEKDTSQIKGLLAIDTTVNFFDLLTTNIETSSETLKTKFPTSIPWDVIAVVTTMSAEPEAPIFDIPLKVESAGIQETIHIDLSETSEHTDMSTLSTVSRNMLTLLFILYLIILTRKMIGKGD